MTPQMQTQLAGKDTIHPGNCFVACLASLLDLPIWMVPPFELMFWRGDEDNHWLSRVNRWLGRMFALRMVRTDGHPASIPAAHYIASGLSPRGVRHSVVYSGGALAHDPHHSGAGLIAVEWCWHLEAL